MHTINPVLVALALVPTAAFAHLTIYDPSMYGFNVTAQTFPYDNRPMTPLMNLPFAQWWFHGLLDYPPNDGDVFSFPAGGSVILPIACNKGLTPFWASSEGTTDIRRPDGYPCPGANEGYGMDLSSIHTTSFADVAGTAIAIVDEDDVHAIQPQDFVVFTVNGTSPWTTNTTYQVPAQMPACTKKYCHCAWFWIHNDDSGSEQNYMTGFRCQITNVGANAKPLGTPQVPRFCPNNPSNCTQGAQNPFYWYQKEGNNMPEGQYDPPIYQPKYGFHDGAQNNIFADGPAPAPAANPGTTSTSAAQTTTTQATTTTSAPTILNPAPTPNPPAQEEAAASGGSNSSPGSSGNNPQTCKRRASARRRHNKRSLFK